ncbi:MAG TPA: HEAT repeat domain-containing protein [Acidimicrobiales bacterium]|nr:HEAT repeat domain-containing protein [Acidimicrobiales bacterium]
MKKHVHEGDPPSKEVAERRRQAILARYENSELEESEITGFLNDTAAVVREAALATVVKLNLDAGKHIVNAFNDDDHGVRKRAIELVIDLSDNQDYISKILVLLDDSSTFVVETVCWVIGEIGNNYENVAEVVNKVSQIALNHDDSLCREAAVACLGSLGHIDGLATLLRVLDDKPNVRRRATLALAPFEGPEVEEALKRKLKDRDLQTRQAAEDLLA